MPRRNQEPSPGSARAKVGTLRYLLGIAAYAREVRRVRKQHRRLHRMRRSSPERRKPGMSVFKCPTNCADHDYFFPHSVVTVTRVIKRELIVTELIICRECDHWIGNRSMRCYCRFHCHEHEGGDYDQRK